MATPEQIYNAIQAISDQNSFVQRLLIDTLGWPIPDGIDDIGDITYEWSGEDLRADGLDKHLADGRIYQIQKLHDDQPWGIFLLEFKHDDVFFKNRGLTGPLRKVLRGLVHNRRKSAALPSWDRDDLLFICTDRRYCNFRFAYFKAPKQTEKTAPLALFGWNCGDTALRTLCDYNLPALVWSDDIHQPQWKDAFSIEKVTKAFFRQVATLFTDLVGGTRKDGSKTHQGKNLLKMPGKQDDTVRKEFAVRLIGRLIFCWFLKKKVSKAGIALVPDDILSTDALANNNGIGGYYHSVLEPLFFELLNTPADSRKKDYRKQPWSYIPFLNGGLFTPHEFDFYEPADTGYSKHINTLLVPDEWLNNLLSVFERYNFTIDENTPIDVELSIEPEMLGRIFENLLAEINPETGETARKSTGSYYTPRPIVEYMVDESLKQYLVTKLSPCQDTEAVSQKLSPGHRTAPEADSNKLSPCQGGVPEGGGGHTTPACGHPSLKGGELEDKISALLSYSQGVPDFSESQIEQIIDALHTVKIIDPACGSGAFPMGILQKILLMLQKLDPDSKRWLHKLLDSIPDPMYRKELKKKIKVPNYLHKLGIIRDCIFGVDIQPIAVEISKLRCFLSLIVDEAIDDTDENRGVEHLPNLEFKFVCANTLIGLPESEQQNDTFIKDMYEDVDNIEKLKELRDLYLISYGKEKKKIEDQFRAVQSAMLNQSIKTKKVNQKTAALQSWNPFADEPCSWFDPEWMFGIKQGFDISIGNPPFVEHKKLKAFSKIFKENFSCYAGTADLYVYFIEKAVSLLKMGGTLSFIISNKFIKTSYGENIRGLLSERNICKLVDFTEVHVFDALVASCVLIVNNESSTNPVSVAFANDKIQSISLSEFVKKHHLVVDKKFLGSNIWLLEDTKRLKIKEAIEKKSTVLKDIEGVQIFRGVTTGYNPAFIIDHETKRELISKDKNNKEIIKPLLQGRNIRKWIYEPSDVYLLQTGYDLNIQRNYHDIYKHLKQFEKELIKRTDQGKSWWNLRACKYYGEFEKEKIIWGLTADKWAFAYDDKKHYLPSNGYILTSTEISIKYLLAILNSNLMQLYFGFEGIMTAGGAFTLKHETIRELPVKNITQSKQKPFINLVDKILTAKKLDPEAETTKLEIQINQMVYELYGLTEDEIAIVEGQPK